MVTHTAYYCSLTQCFNTPPRSLQFNSIFNRSHYPLHYGLHQITQPARLVIQEGAKKGWEPWPEPPSYVPNPTPLYILRKYTGTFSTTPSASSTHQKSLAMNLTRNLLYFKHLPNVKIQKPISMVVNKSKNKSVKGKSRVDSQGKVTKTAVAVPKKTTAAAVVTLDAGAAAQVEKSVTSKDAVKEQVKKTAAAATTLSEAMATKVTAPKPMTPKAAFPSPTPSIPSTLSTFAAAGLGVEITAPTPTAPVPAAPSLLFLAINGVPQFRIGGSTPEETEKNNELNAMGLLHGKNELVAFDVKDGEIRGVRVKGELYVRVGAAEKR